MKKTNADKEKEVPAGTIPEDEPVDTPDKVLQDDTHDFRQKLIDIGMDFSERLKNRQGINESDIRQLDSLRVLYDTLACHRPIE